MKVIVQHVEELSSKLVELHALHVCHSSFVRPCRGKGT